MRDDTVYVDDSVKLDDGTIIKLVCVDNSLPLSCVCSVYIYVPEKNDDGYYVYRKIVIQRYQTDKVEELYESLVSKKITPFDAYMSFAREYEGWRFESCDNDYKIKYEEQDSMFLIFRAPDDHFDYLKMTFEMR